MEESNVIVAVRVRPMNPKEIANEDLDVARVEDNLIVILDPVQMEYQAENRKMLDVYHRSKEQRYAFDQIFREESQEEIYECTCKHLIKPVLSGYNATVFAYGPTGTGKTYTMLGNQEVMGLSVLTIRDIFDYIRKDDENEFIVQITYVEIYNESIRDLLVTQSSYLELRDDPIKGIMIAGVTEYQAQSTEEVMTLLHSGNKRRTTESTNANQTSSRSHAVFQIVVTTRSKTRSTEVETLVGKLSLIDLAGSERGTVTENRGIRLREGAKINQSLLALANCINALGDKAKKGFFVPYRDSKLTRLLKDSLGGNCRTVMIANISPSGSQFEETINTLKYANRAKNIKTKQVANKKLVAIHIAEYKSIINDLRNEIDLLKHKLYDRPIDKQYDRAIDRPIEDSINEEEQMINNYVGKSAKCTCSFKQEDEGEMRRIQETIYENFQERIQLRRALMEIEEQNATNYLEIRRRQAEITQWRKSEESVIDETKRKVPEDVKQNAKAVQTLRTSSDKNSIKKELMGLQLVENISNARRIRDAIPKKIKSKEKRDFLELEIKNHVLELQNIELEINLQIQEKTITDLKYIIENQRKLIEQNDPPDEDDDYDDVDHILDDLLDEEDIIDIDPFEEDEDLVELEHLKAMAQQQKQAAQNSPQEQKRGRDNNDFNHRRDNNDFNPKQQRDRSAPNNRKQQPTQKVAFKPSEELSINGVNLIDDEGDDLNKQQRKRDDSKIKQNPKVLQNQGSYKQIQAVNSKITQGPKVFPQSNQQPDLSLNLKGNNMPLQNNKIITKPPKKKQP